MAEDWLALVPDSYVDAYRERRPIAPAVRAAVLAAMGLGPDEGPADPGAVMVVRPGGAVPTAGEVTLEDGTPLGRVDRLPPDVPFGYHHVTGDDGHDWLLITGPGSCQVPPGLRGWGWAVQLAATRSRRSWGIGDLGDLRDLATWSAGVGASFLAVSPLGAPNPGPMPEPSPYYPSTRRFGNPIHLGVTDVPGAKALGAAAGELNDGRWIDRPAIWARKREALERAWASGAARDAFDAWRASDAGAALERWAAFSVISERRGPGWHSWPAELRRPNAPALEGIARDPATDFHAWLQWCFDRQLAAASTPLRRIADMPVGVDPGGFDAWDWQDQLAIGVTVGAPPDRFNTVGQDWGLPPFVPHLLRQAGYVPFIETIRAQLRHAGGLRIDHVLGMFRQWWIPAGSDPSDGAYVRYPTDELLEIVAIESHRARAIVIGEDLGTVPPGVRAELRRRKLLSTRLALFERTEPARYPRQAFAAVTTHDLPTIAGLWRGSDLDDQAAAGLRPNLAGNAILHRRLTDAAGLGADASLATLTSALHRRLAAAPSALVAATLEDALGVEERPNLPGTVASQRDNWSLALPVPIEELGDHPGVRAVVEALSSRGG
jgi:4-alpha-glucanotransferase